MRVLYDHQAFSLQDYGGITRIFTELLKGVPSTGNTALLPLLYSNNTHLREASLQPDGICSRLPIKRRSIVYAMNELYDRVQAYRCAYDVYHPTYYSGSLRSATRGVPMVATYHDLIHEKLSGRFPELAKEHKLIRQKAALITDADAVIAVSENTKKDLIAHYGVSGDKISVIYLGNSFATPDVNAGSPYTRPYLLFVGNRGLYKNFLPFLRAIHGILLSRDIMLICAGGRPFSQQETDEIRKIGVTDRVLYSDVSDDVLATLYTNALAFVFPSLYEGFGIPILEAFSCNCTCLLSNMGSLPEIAGDAAVYMDPYDEHSMYTAVARVVDDELLRASLIVKGGERLKHFSWKKHVEETIAVYKKVVNKS